MSRNSQRDYEQLPDHETALLARESASELSRLLNEQPEADRATVKLDGHNLILPRQALLLLRDLLADLAQGNAVSIVPRNTEMTTQQAAEILNVSRPYLIKLLELGELAFTMVGTHRRVKFGDLMAYREKNKRRSAEAMDELAKITQENNMGY